MKNVFKITAAIVVLLSFSRVNAQDYSNQLHVAGPAQYLKQVRQDSNKKLVELKKYIPGIVLDIRYATSNNFMKRRMYPQARAFARLPVAKALKQVQAELKKSGLGLKIYDAYRPYSITVQFYKMARDTNFVADPRKGSKHNRGCALDLTIINLTTGRELDMPTGFDSFSKKAASNYTDLPEQQKANRLLLQSAMVAHGFRIIPTEWWHFDFATWPQYPLLDIPFSAIKQYTKS